VSTAVECRDRGEDFFWCKIHLFYEILLISNTMISFPPYLCKIYDIWCLHMMYLCIRLDIRFLVFV
jgi:hypothetical protein